MTKARFALDKDGSATIRDVGIEARKINPKAFAADISRSAPDRQKWIDQRMAALTKARAKLESGGRKSVSKTSVDKTSV